MTTTSSVFCCLFFPSLKVDDKNYVLFTSHDRDIIIYMYVYLDAFGV